MRDIDSEVIEFKNDCTFYGLLDELLSNACGVSGWGQTWSTSFKTRCFVPSLDVLKDHKTI